MRRGVLVLATVVAVGFALVGVPSAANSALGVPSAADSAVTDDHEIEIDDAELSDEEIRAGETVTVTVEVENEREQAASTTVRLLIDGAVVETTTVRLGPDEEATVEFAHAFERPGRYQVWVLGDGPGRSNGERAGMVTVAESAPEDRDDERDEDRDEDRDERDERDEDRDERDERDDDGDEGPDDEPDDGPDDETAEDAVEPGSVEVVDASTVADWVREGHTTTVDVTVVNPGERPATRTITVTVDGEAVARENVTLAPGERTEVTVEIPAAEGTVTVDGVEAGTLSVGEPETPTPDDLSPVDTPGFGLRLVGLLLAVVALLGRLAWR